MKSAEIRNLVSNLLPSGISKTRLPNVTEPLAGAYLAYAVTDLDSEDSKRTRVNALSNAKRAIHRRIDCLAEGLGIMSLPSKDRRTFPQKLSFCKRCAVIGPRIVDKLNRVRNEMEHEYSLPSREEVENFVDVAELFLAATDILVYSFPKRIEFDNLEDGGTTLFSVAVALPPSTGNVLISGWLLEMAPGDLADLFSEKKTRDHGHRVLLPDFQKTLSRLVQTRNAELKETIKLPDEEFYAWASLCIESSRWAN